LLRAHGLIFPVSRRMMPLSKRASVRLCRAECYPLVVHVVPARTPMAATTRPTTPPSTSAQGTTSDVHHSGVSLVLDAYSEPVSGA
jgi:hypothetical protein